MNKLDKFTDTYAAEARAKDGRDFPSGVLGYPMPRYKPRRPSAGFLSGHFATVSRWPLLPLTHFETRGSDDNGSERVSLNCRAGLQSAERAQSGVSLNLPLFRNPIRCQSALALFPKSYGDDEGAPKRRFAEALGPPVVRHCASPLSGRRCSLLRLPSVAPQRDAANPIGSAKSKSRVSLKKGTEQTDTFLVFAKGISSG